MTRDQQVRYWKENLAYIVVLLAVWFSSSFLAGIVFADRLDAI
ncbi:MAG TPA: sodium/substrate symporter small subunit, partial [Anaeromyxobacteraceae bacterium]|nr:sodium/substrate symporter small subunit [Anaeromyxobacteraceae bacterium]